MSNVHNYEEAALGIIEEYKAVAGWSRSRGSSGNYDEEWLAKKFAALLQKVEIEACLGEYDFAKQYRDYTGRKYITENMIASREEQLREQLAALRNQTGENNE